MDQVFVGWMKLGDLCDVYSGYAFKEFNNNNIGRPVIKIGNILENGSIDTNNVVCSNEDVDNKYLSKKDDVYVALSGATTGKVGIMPNNNYLINQRVGIVRLLRHDIPAKYIYYFLQNATDRILNDAMGAAQPNISPKQLLNYAIEEKDKEEIGKIVTILDLTNNLIENRKHQISLLDDLIKSRFVEMFGDIIKNEKSWSEEEWSNLLIIKNGRNQKNVEDSNGKYPICGSGGIMGYANEYITEANAVIIGRKGNINKPILMSERFWNVDTAFGLEPINKLLNVEYLYYFCVFFDFEKLNKAVTIPSLTKADLLKIKMPLPPLLLQNQFADFVTHVNKSKFIEIQKLIMVDNLRSYFINSLL